MAPHHRATHCNCGSLCTMHVLRTGRPLSSLRSLERRARWNHLCRQLRWCLLICNESVHVSSLHQGVWQTRVMACLNGDLHAQALKDGR